MQDEELMEWIRKKVREKVKKRKEYMREYMREYIKTEKHKKYRKEYLKKYNKTEQGREKMREWNKRWKERKRAKGFKLKQTWVKDDDRNSSGEKYKMTVKESKTTFDEEQKKKQLRIPKEYLKILNQNKSRKI